MPSLTSCYFCGDAVSASLEEYDLPADASPDEQVTVTLCAGCKGKLTELLDEIDPAGGDAGAAADPTTATDVAGSSSAESDADPAIEADPDLDPVAGDQEPIFADDGDTVLDEELPAGASVEERPFASDEDDEAADEIDDSSVADTDAPSDPSDRDERTARSEEQASDADASEADGAIEAPPAGETESDPDQSNAADGAEPAASGATDEDEGSADATTTPPVEANAGGSGSTSSTPSGAPTNATSGAGGSSTDGPLADVSPRTYNRVVRLLQNREFPVDRADFEALATSAYELDHGECEAALDGAIEKGLLEEREGMLYRPE